MRRTIIMLLLLRNMYVCFCLLKFKTMKSLDNMKFSSLLVLHSEAESLLVCAQRCLKNDHCRSFAFRKEETKCTMHDMKFTSQTSGTYEQGWKYFTSKCTFLGLQLQPLTCIYMHGLLYSSYTTDQ